MSTYLITGFNDQSALIQIAFGLPSDMVPDMPLNCPSLKLFWKETVKNTEIKSVTNIKPICGIILVEGDRSELNTQPDLQE